MGAEGLREVSEAAVLNANYIKASLKDHYEIPYEQYCKHEFVLVVLNKRTWSPYLRYGKTFIRLWCSSTNNLFPT